MSYSPRNKPVMQVFVQVRAYRTVMSVHPRHDRAKTAEPINFNMVSSNYHPIRRHKLYEHTLY